MDQTITVRSQTRSLPNPNPLDAASQFVASSIVIAMRNVLRLLAAVWYAAASFAAVWFVAASLASLLQSAATAADEPTNSDTLRWSLAPKRAGPIPNRATP